MRTEEALELIGQVREVLQNVPDERLRNPIIVLLRQTLTPAQMAELKNMNESTAELVEVISRLPEGTLHTLDKQLIEAFRVGRRQVLDDRVAQLNQTIGIPAATAASHGIMALLVRWTYATAPNTQAGAVMRDFSFYLTMFNFATAAPRIYFSRAKLLQRQVSWRAMCCVAKSTAVAAVALLPLAFFHSGLLKMSSTLANGYLNLIMGTAFLATALYTVSENYALASSTPRREFGAGTN